MSLPAFFLFFFSFQLIGTIDSCSWTGVITSFRIIFRTKVARQIIKDNVRNVASCEKWNVFELNREEHAIMLFVNRS